MIYFVNVLLKGMCLHIRTEKALNFETFDRIQRNSSSSSDGIPSTFWFGARTLRLRPGLFKTIASSSMPALFGIKGAYYVWFAAAGVPLTLTSLNWFIRGTGGAGTVISDTFDSFFSSPWRFSCHLPSASNFSSVVLYDYGLDWGLEMTSSLTAALIAFSMTGSSST